MTHLRRCRSYRDLTDPMVCYPSQSRLRNCPTDPWSDGQVTSHIFIRILVKAVSKSVDWICKFLFNLTLQLFACIMNTLMGDSNTRKEPENLIDTSDQYHDTNLGKPMSLVKTALLLSMLNYMMNLPVVKKKDCKGKCQRSKSSVEDCVKTFHTAEDCDKNSLSPLPKKSSSQIILPKSLSGWNLHSSAIQPIDQSIDDYQSIDNYQPIDSYQPVELRLTRSCIFIPQPFFNGMPWSWLHRCPGKKMRLTSGFSPLDSRRSLKKKHLSSTSLRWEEKNDLLGSLPGQRYLCEESKISQNRVTKPRDTINFWQELEERDYLQQHLCNPSFSKTKRYYNFPSKPPKWAMNVIKSSSNTSMKYQNESWEIARVRNSGGGSLISTERQQPALVRISNISENLDQALGNTSYESFTQNYPHPENYRKEVTKKYNRQKKQNFKIAEESILFIRAVPKKLFGILKRSYESSEYLSSSTSQKFRKKVRFGDSDLGSSQSLKKKGSSESNWQRLVKRRFPIKEEPLKRIVVKKRLFSDDPKKYPLYGQAIKREPRLERRGSKFYQDFR